MFQYDRSIHRIYYERSPQNRRQIEGHLEDAFENTIPRRALLVVSFDVVDSDGVEHDHV